MPFYDLHCTDCNTEHNISASMREKSEKLIACPSCGSFDLETIFRAPPAVVRRTPDLPSCPSAGACGGSCRHAG